MIFIPDEIDPFDFFSQNYWFEDRWVNVLKADEEVVKAYSEHSLFLCWPPLESKMVFNALKKYRNSGGKILIYIGDPLSSADESFFNELKQDKLIHELNIPSWSFINEKLMIYSL